MSELSCDTLFIGRNETHDLSRYQNSVSCGTVGEWEWEWEWEWESSIHWPK